MGPLTTHGPYTVLWPDCIGSMHNIVLNTLSSIGIILLIQGISVLQIQLGKFKAIDGRKKKHLHDHSKSSSPAPYSKMSMLEVSQIRAPVPH